MKALARFLVVGFIAVSGCGDEHQSSASSSAPSFDEDAGANDGDLWSSWPAQLEREVTNADVGPLCLTFTGTVSGTYTEHVAHDERSSVGVFEFAGEEESLDELEVLYRRLDDCRGDELQITQLEATETLATWEVRAGIDGIAGEADFLGFSRRGDRARVVFGSGPDVRGNDGDGSWTL